MIHLDSVQSSIGKKRMHGSIIETDEVVTSSACSKKARPLESTITSLSSSSLLNKEKQIVNPQNLLVSILKEEGYDATTKESSRLKDFFLEVTDEHIAAYDQVVVKAVKDRNIAALREMHQNGRTLQCSNRFGESLIHMACRRGLTDIVRFFVKEAEVSLRVKDDFGRTPLHDACWSSTPNFPLLELLIEHDPDLLLVNDVRGHSPFSYARRNHWNEWTQFLNERRKLLKLRTFVDASDDVDETNPVPTIETKI